ncbi:WD40-repeat-containing domain protein [Pyronema domesticum]|uniref:Similar to WD repeat-containing protein pop2 acc. no. O14170 n=1 Tax=Pyronema omphalodes (strain CBS 100304) TaxID=1076935 RepID=U4LFT3_PYROM|nr:WD40-repeat-containing domain protein [Pyronema domesticum]CCX14312.1 Similar to WD repeat-containing protein pop2; acc. no. O14170 [Pyronema omphalodes CBS 100304]
MDPPSIPNAQSTRRTQQTGMPTSLVSRTPTSERPFSAMTTRETKRKAAPHTTVGHFSYAPTTQTTVVTTTTTTTTTFPQLVMQPPKHLNELDPKEYPLAAVPTPQNLRRFCFDVDGKTTQYVEEDDADESIIRLEELVSNLNRNNGVIRTEVRGKEFVLDQSSSSPLASALASNPLSVLNRKRPASPISISEAAERVATSLSRVQKRRHTARSRPGALDKPNTPSPKKGTRSGRNTTPQIATNDSQVTTMTTHAPRPIRPVHQQLSQIQSTTPLMSPQQFTPTQIPAHQQETPLTLSPQLVPTAMDDDEDVIMTGSPSPQDDMDSDHTAQEDLSLDNEVDSDDISRPRQAGDIPLSLPSPRASPVTNAAQYNGAHYFTTMDGEDITSPLDLQPNEEDTLEDTEMAMIRTPSRDVASMDIVTGHMQPGSLMEIPTMLDTFDAMPASVKSYVMYQLLRRCSKTTLQTVASVVNPALMCDFLGLLPSELSLEIIKYLDVKSLCAAAQVSKTWRLLIDSDEWTWKKLFDADGFVLQDGELDRAVREGWGYQDPRKDDDYEIDINHSLALTKTKSSTGSTKKAKLGSNRQLRPSSSKQKEQKNRETVEKLGKAAFNEVLSEIISNSAGPSSAADAAERHHSRANLGLESLSNLHLFKSIYRRHYVIRRSWLQPDVKPKHISFRGHEHHVVTCLQFDMDKILTGSDDTNINVYDTNNGVLRATLNGHEGGVWALQYDGNTLVSGSTDRTVRVWDIAKGLCTQIFHGHTSTVRCLQILLPTKVRGPDGRETLMPKYPLIITGSRDSTLRVWKLPKPTDNHYLPEGHDAEAFLNPANNPYFLRTLTGHQHSVRAISAHGDTLVSGSYDHTVKVWKISTGEILHTLRGHTQKVYSVVLDHQRNRCISGSMDNMVKVWSLDTGTVLYTLEGHSQLVGLLDLSHDRLVSAAADSTLRIWDPETGQCKHTLTAHTGAITCFQHDETKVISGSDRTVKMWNIKTGEFVRDLLTDLTGVWQVKFNERRCVAAVQRDQVTYIEVLDFGAARDGVPESDRGRRIVVDLEGNEVSENDLMDEDGE